MKKRGATLYRARILNPISPASFEEFSDGALVVGEDGKILACGDCADLKDRVGGLDTVRFDDTIIVPGLIDCHLHLPQLDQRGKHSATLLEWLEKYIFPAEMAFEDLKVAEDVSKRFFKKLILNGTTTSAVYVTTHPNATDMAFEIAETTGLRVIMGKVMMDQNAPARLSETTKRSIDESARLYEKWHGRASGRLRYSFVPRFGPTCSEKLWRSLGELMRGTEAYLQTHISETPEEVKSVKELFPDYNDYTDLYERNGCLTPRTILAHAIYISPDECRRMKASGAKIAHCPTSNLFLKSGRMPLEMIEAAGITYGLGTDIGAGTSMSLFSCMRHADFVQPKLSIRPEKAFYLATLGGARVLSMEREIGNFKRGKRADFVVVDIKGIDPRYELSELSAEEILSLLMYRGSGNVVKEVYVDGKKLDVDAIVMKGDTPPLQGGGR